MADLETVLARYPGAVAFTFGDSADLNAEILALVRSGAKTKTCDASAAFAARGETLPAPGRTDNALDWQGRPVLALRTLSVERLRFCEMDSARVAPQGEFTDLDHWRRGYEAYLRRSGHFSPDVEMILETFECVEVFA